MADLSASIRAYALTGNRHTEHSSLEHCIVESFLMPGFDWEYHSLWSVEWRTFALIVAEALDARSEHRWAFRRAADYIEAKQPGHDTLDSTEWPPLVRALRAAAHGVREDGK